MENEKLKHYQQIPLSVCKTPIVNQSCQIWSDLLLWFYFCVPMKLCVQEKCAKEIFAFESQNSSTLQCNTEHINVVYSYLYEFINMVMWKI